MPDDAGRRVLMDGRLNLEQQKKRAKELFKALQAGDSAALSRLRAGHPEGPRLAPTHAQLADAQLVLARENGFGSWTQMKRYTEDLTEARAAAKRPDLAPDSAGVLHIRCGSDLKRALTRAGFQGQFRMLTDPLCMGPVHDLPAEAFLAERAAFVAATFGLYADTALDRVRGEYAGAMALDDVSSICLWFEHDSYDQLILAWLLNRYAALETPPISLICADRAPGVATFVGLGQLAPEVVRLMWADRRPVDRAMLDLGRKVWTAVTDDSPEALFALARAGTPAVPPMAGALLRHLQELPSTATGLGLSEQLALDVLLERGPLPAPDLFQASQAVEPLPYLGDMMFWGMLARLAADGLIDAPPQPGDWHQSWARRTVALTDRGAAVRIGGAERWTRDAQTAWVGGVRLDPSGPIWRWDTGDHRPVLTRARP